MDIMREVTERIISQLEKGIVPWHQTWYGKQGCISGVTGKGYSLINQCLLGRPGEYYTFKQITELGGKVKKGEKASKIVFWKVYEKETDELDEKGNKKVEKIPVLKWYSVFDIDQTEGIEAKYNKTFDVDMSDDDEAENLVYDYIDRESIAFDICKGKEPTYDKGNDVISCPEVTSFKSSGDYFSVVYHLMVNSTANEKRLNRDYDDVKENLIGELGAACLCNLMGLETKDTFDNSAAYIQKWIEALEKDRTLIVSASGKAEKAIKYILEGEAA